MMTLNIANANTVSAATFTTQTAPFITSQHTKTGLVIAHCRKEPFHKKWLIVFFLGRFLLDFRRTVE